MGCHVINIWCVWYCLRNFSDEEFDISEEIHDSIQPAHISSSRSSIAPPVVSFDTVETSLELFDPGMMHIFDHSFI